MVNNTHVNKPKVVFFRRAIGDTQTPDMSRFASKVVFTIWDTHSPKVVFFRRTIVFGSKVISPANMSIGDADATDLGHFGQNKGEGDSIKMKNHLRH